MPQGESFWNPYRWVTVSKHPVKHDEPHYHHTSSGLSGRLWCELEALTPLIIGDGHGQFVLHQHNQRPYIPATSLKGAMRSLAEVVGNAATFGYLNRENVLAGLIHFSDAKITVEPPNPWDQYKVVVGQPKPNHGAFYPGNNQRKFYKFYHHHPGAEHLVGAPASITQTVNITPAPPGTCFRFTVDFVNLREAELNLLLYCLTLEEKVDVTFSPEALGPNAQGPVTLTGPLRHKIGGAKPHGAGSVRISIAKMKLRKDAKSRYRGSDKVEIWKACALACELDSRTTLFRGCTDNTMKELRAMLIYSTKDLRTPIRYPGYSWFRTNPQTPLKPTI